MLLIATYEDLLTEIEVYEERLKDLEREQYAIDRLVKSNTIDYYNQLERQMDLNNKYAITQSILEDKKETQRQMLEKIQQLEGLEYKIAYKRFIEGKTLNEIAGELGYSYDYIRELSSKAKRTHNYPTQTAK
mgnify:FL=1